MRYLMTITTNTYNYEYEFHRTDIPDKTLARLRAFIEIMNII